MSNYEPPPYQDPIGYSLKGLQSYLGDVWQRWFLGFLQRVNRSAEQFPLSVDLDAQTAAIGLTPIPLPSLQGGNYRVNVYLRVTTPASVTSSILATIHFTDGGIACTRATAAVTGNTTDANGGAVMFLRIDQGTPISYSTSYASNAAGMAYALVIAVEGMPN